MVTAMKLMIGLALAAAAIWEAAPFLVVALFSANWN